jgi:DMSO/TMAO reductase YedYZ molybdopterin-dependent catalytic subunit
MNNNKVLPPGQKETAIFPRFGLPQYANRFPKEVDKISFSIGGDVEEFQISNQLQSLPRTHQISDFHCVTTWSKLNLNWSGYRFKDFYTALIQPKVSAAQEITFVILKAQDGYKTSLPLSDLMNENVLLADQLNHQPLTIEHGAPIRIVAPDHYGYKNLKHIKRIEFYTERKVVKQGILGFMDHPRGRVAYEERAVGPGIFFRWLYKFGIKKTMRDFEKATAKYKAELKNKTEGNKINL